MYLNRTTNGMSSSCQGGHWQIAKGKPDWLSLVSHGSVIHAILKRQFFTHFCLDRTSNGVLQSSCRCIGSEDRARNGSKRGEVAERQRGSLCQGQGCPAHSSHGYNPIKGRAFAHPVSPSSSSSLFLSPTLSPSHTHSHTHFSITQVSHHLLHFNTLKAQQQKNDSRCRYLEPLPPQGGPDS
jgi:hypothetical protein